jgi:hypothetical protein
LPAFDLQERLPAFSFLGPDSREIKRIPKVTNRKEGEERFPGAKGMMEQTY